jgi:hypothetical protein
MITWRDCPGWFGWQDLYDEVALTTPPGSSVVEVGVAFGRSLLYLAKKIKDTGKDIKVYAVDPWEPYKEMDFCYPEIYGVQPKNEQEWAAYNCRTRHGGVFPAFLHHLYESGLSDIVRVVRANSIAASMLFEYRLSGKISHPPYFVFIDGDHTQRSVENDLDVWWDTGPEWMAGHDFDPPSETNFPGVWKAVHQKWGEQQIETDGQGCWIARRARIDK